MQSKITKRVLLASIATCLVVAIPSYYFLLNLFDDLSPSLNFVTSVGGSFEINRDIRSVSLASTDITNDDLVHVRRMNPRSEINLSDTSIDDHGLSHLRGVRTGRIILKNTNVTQTGIAKLKPHLVQHCVVLWTNPNEIENE